MALRQDRAVTDVLENGDTGTDAKYKTYDGENLFSNSHTLNSTAFDNLRSGALTATTFQEAKNILRRVPLAEDGTNPPTNLGTFYLIVPNELEEAARLILNNDYLYDQTNNTTGVPANNPYKGSAQLIVNGLLQDTSDWYMILDMPGHSPFVTIEHMGYGKKVIPLLDEKFENVYRFDRYEWLFKLVQETYPFYYFQMVKYTNS